MGSSPGRGRRRYNWTCQFYLTRLSSELSPVLPWTIKALTRPYGLALDALPELPSTLEVKASAGRVNSLWMSLTLQPMKQHRGAAVSSDYVARLG